MNWTLTIKDLYLLTKMLGAKVLVGIPNPFLRHRAEDMEQEWEDTFKKLHKMELVDLVEGELKFEEDFIQTLWVMAKSNMITEILTDQSDQSLFYFSEDKVVEVRKRDEEAYDLQSHPAPDWTWNQVIIPRMLTGVENIPVRQTKSLYLTPEEYNIYCATMKLENKDELAKRHALLVEEPIIKQLDMAIQRKIHTNRLMTFYRGDEQWRVEGMHLLTSPSANWTLRMVQKDGNEVLEAKQSQGQALMDEILGVVQRVKVKQPS
ncbi:hypothetical protein [Sutcliffiella horikoshii]|uniref:hypothetical protein n=1 Tax=Sutcliffiella horikoshii TaxID=79883 RepID=UPI001F2A2B25|nr:hypothetical protein [Sutcliffiella horikoshii]MCG1021171.1 hypothetical protein [Sutcliffiella horikoshii]